MLGFDAICASPLSAMSTTLLIPFAVIIQDAPLWTVVTANNTHWIASAADSTFWTCSLDDSPGM